MEVRLKQLNIGMMISNFSGFEKNDSILQSISDRSFFSLTQTDQISSLVALNLIILLNADFFVDVLSFKKTSIASFYQLLPEISCEGNNVERSSDPRLDAFKKKKIL
jgi:hypothetical protein